MRKDLDKGQDVPCCFAKTLENAERLTGEYEQQWIDGGGEDTTYYYVMGNVFYDQ